MARLGELTWRFDRRRFAVLGAAAAVTAVATPLALVLVQIFVDAVAAGDGWSPGLVALVVAAGLAAGLRWALEPAIQGRMVLYGSRVADDARRRLFAVLATADFASLDRPDWYDAAQRAREAVHWRAEKPAHRLIQLIETGVGGTGTVLVVAAIHPVLAALAVLAVGPLALAGYAVGERLRRLRFAATAEQRARDYHAEILTEPHTAAEVRAYGLGPALVERWSALDDAEDRRLRAATRRSRGLLAGASAMTVVSMVAAYLLLASLAEDGSLGAGAVAAAAGALVALNGYVGATARAASSLAQDLAVLTDLFAVLGSERLVSVGSSPVGLPVRLDGGSGGISFEGVRFAYPGSGGWALDGCDLSVAPGEVLALVGDNGAGKTTLVRLLLRLYDPQGGCVRLGGVDLREADPDEVRSRVGVLFSDFATYQLSVRDNVGFGRVERPAADEAVWAALSAAAAVGVAEDLGGLDANAGRLFEGGHDLSGGQWQRLALARLCFRDAMVWVLDEPTAALDPEAEAEVFGRLREWLAGRTGIVISHRFSTVRQADRIAVLERGRVVEYGTHDELVARGGRYATMFELQAANYR